jgi:N-acetylmuramoyl-L-alanine amidase
MIVLLGAAAAAILVAVAVLAGPAPTGGSSAAPRELGSAGPCPAGGRAADGVGTRRSLTAGRSVRGRRIVARLGGCRGAPARVLVVGSIHGTERAGHAVIRRLRAMRIPRTVELWTVRTVNPDGVALGTRQNTRGVDLNRNFPSRWRHQGRPFDTYYSGPKPLSEPESRAVRRLARRIRPQLTVWYHQSLGLVDLGSGADPRLVRAYARRSGLPTGRIGFLPGVVTRWQNERFPGSSAFVAELRAGALPASTATRQARAVLSASRLVRTSSWSAAGRRSSSAAGRRPAAAASARPRIVQWRIPFGSRRKREMRAYARRHYGIDDYRLRAPRVVVLHLSAGDSTSAVYETFARDRPDPELGELPGLCAHFVVDPRGRILQLVSLRLMCRHTVGLNHVSIGIEHVGRRETEVFARRRQVRASLRLVRWLRERYRIAIRHVIGHNESLRSPFHRERVRRLRRQTHADFPSRFAGRYRRSLGG